MQVLASQRLAYESCPEGHAFWYHVLLQYEELEQVSGVRLREASPSHRRGS